MGDGCLASIIAIVLVALIYQGTITLFSREKSLLVKDTGNGSTRAPTASMAAMADALLWGDR